MADPDPLRDPLAREWLLADGEGGYASSTVSGAPTRRYHGWLVRADPPPRDRRVLLSRCEEWVEAGGSREAISAGFYPGTVFPTGFRRLRRFAVDPLPRWQWSVHGALVERTIALPRHRRTVVVRYANRGAVPFKLELRPLLALRPYHELARRRDLAAVADLRLTITGAETREADDWYFNVEYPAERERGYDFQEDLWNPIVLARDLDPGQEAFFTAGEATAADGPELFAEAISCLPPRDRSEDGRTYTLRSTAADFLVSVPGGVETVIAGYPWFADWGRDSMIALPGLAPGRAGLPILRTFAAAIAKGLLPNRFREDGTAEYSSADAPLWFVRAAVAAAPDSAEEEELAPRVFEILDAYHDGTDFGIRMDDSDGLVTQGLEGRALTWMDAVIDGEPVTQRRGKAVEINALWYSALRDGASLALRQGDAERSAAYSRLAGRVRENFARVFWDDDAGYLADVVDGGIRDLRVRPNALFALSLCDGLVELHQAIRVFHRASQELYTPFGLRSLSPTDPAYRGRCEGDTRSRDLAYHQGTVWPWLIGPFLDAHFRLAGVHDESRRQARHWLAPLLAHATGAGLGHVPEIFDGDAPHTPRGCIAQAWSSAEILRVARQYGL